MSQHFEHNREEFLAVRGAIHEAFSPYPGVRYLIGARQGLVVAWRIALGLTAAAGLFASIAAIITSDLSSLLATGPVAAIGISGLAMLRGRRGPLQYEPKNLVAPSPNAPL